MPVTDKPLCPHLPTVRQPISANVYLRRDPLELAADEIGKFVYNFTHTHNIAVLLPIIVVYIIGTRKHNLFPSPRVRLITSVWHR